MLPTRQFSLKHYYAMKYFSMPFFQVTPETAVEHLQKLWPQNPELWLTVAQVSNHPGPVFTCCVPAGLVFAIVIVAVFFFLISFLVN